MTRTGSRGFISLAGIDDGENDAREDGDGEEFEGETVFHGGGIGVSGETPSCLGSCKTPRQKSAKIYPGPVTRT